jgi:protein PhnA
MSDLPDCPQCGSDNTYADGDRAVCAVCGHEWPSAPQAEVQGAAPKDSNGANLSAGDTVIVIKDLKVKGSSIPLKQGTLIRNIRLVDGDPEHIEGHSDKIRGLVLKTCFLKKA